MRLKAVLLLLAIMLLPDVASAGGTLQERMDRVLARSCASRTDYSIMVKSINKGRVIYERNSKRLLIPASNMKLVTALTSLHSLRPSFLFKTAVHHTGRRTNGTIEGDLVIEGGGDPHMVMEDLFVLATKIKKRGIKEITGDLVLDLGYFDKAKYPKGWKVSRHRRAYEAPISPLGFNFNSFSINIYPPRKIGDELVVSLEPDSPYFTLVNRLRVVVGGKNSVSIGYNSKPDGGEEIIISGTINVGAKERTYYRSVKRPSEYFGMTFIEYLRQQGVTLRGGISTFPPNRQLHLLFVHDSKPMFWQVAMMNKFSNNYMAELLFKTMGAERAGMPGTQAAAAKVVSDSLIELGIPSSGFVVADGSGFSRGNRLSADTIVMILEKIFMSWDIGYDFMSSLAVMGRDGSVRERMAGTKKVIRVKTGTLNGVSALSGYYPLENGDILMFSFLFNKIPCNIQYILKAQNQLLWELGK